MRTVLMLILVGVVLGCGGVTPYAQSFQQQRYSGGRWLIRIQVSDDTSDIAVKDYALRRASELCPGGFDTDANLSDLDIDESNDLKTVDINIVCKAK